MERPKRQPDIPCLCGLLYDSTLDQIWRNMGKEGDAVAEKFEEIANRKPTVFHLAAGRFVQVTNENLTELQELLEKAGIYIEPYGTEYGRKEWCSRCETYEMNIWYEIR